MSMNDKKNIKEAPNITWIKTLVLDDKLKYEEDMPLMESVIINKKYFENSFIEILNLMIL